MAEPLSRPTLAARIASAVAAALLCLLVWRIVEVRSAPPPPPSSPLLDSLKTSAKTAPVKTR